MSNEGKGVGAWDDEVERGEAEKQEEQEADAVAVSAAGEAEKQEEQEADAVAVSAAGDAASSVSQRESGSGTPKPEKKTLSESRGGPAGGAGGVGGKSGDSGGFGEIPTLLSEMMRLSTREREWDDDERGSGRLGWRSAYHGGGTRSEEKSGSSSYEWFDDLGERTGEGVGSSPRDGRHGPLHKRQRLIQVPVHHLHPNPSALLHLV
uniref:Uncharacterized protein n=1 Tax=Kalanchoe fedtschenkoi TaxID=63787 RepID=A0A7N1A7A7_KALFE